MTFEEVWAEAGPIRGWLSRGEARILFGLASAVEPGHCVVEIGSYCGRATTVLAGSGRQVVAIDPLAPGTASGGREVAPEHADELERVAAGHPNVEWVRLPAAEAHAPGRPVGLLFIDGDHEWPAPILDFERLEGRLAPGGLVAFHDYRVCPGVTRTVDELIAAGRLMWVRKKERLLVARRPDGPGDGSGRAG
jgi:predicted O-methyltransferase YrrM